MSGGILTREFIKANTIAFFPASEGEAKYIQKRLFALGASWVNNGATVYSGAVCVRDGMLCVNGTMYTFSEDSTRQAIICDVRALSPFVDAATLTLEARVKELEQQVDTLTQALKPTTLIKPLAIGKKGPQ